MRTTITVDSDVEALLREAMRRSGQGFKHTLNEAVRKGLADIINPSQQPPFDVASQPMGLRPGIDPVQLQKLGDDLEVDAFLNLTQRLSNARNENG